MQIPYWYYVSGNNIIQEQLPTVRDMEREVELFIENRLNNCDLDRFYEKGFFIEAEEPTASVSISEDNVEISVDSDLTVSLGESSSRKTSHEVSIPSKIGKFYDLARDIYSLEK